MPNVDQDLVEPPDGERSVDRGGETDAVARFVADMGVVDAATLAGFLGHCRYFLGLGEALRRVEQPARKADRAVAHRARNQRLHLGKLG